MKSETHVDEISDFEDELKGKPLKKKKKKFKNCHYCDKLFDVNSSGDKFKKKYRCSTCSDLNIERRFTVRDTVCCYCGIKFIDTYYIKLPPAEKKCLRKKCEECRYKKIPKGPLPRPKVDKHECDLCGKTFRKKINIYHHMDRHRSDVCCRVCNAKFTARSALRGHLRTHFEKHICEICGFTTNIIQQFRNHKKIHAGLPLPKHKYVYRKNIQPRGEFPCAECGIIYHTKAGLITHEKRQHSAESGINGFVCKICGDVSYRTKEYRIHVLSHSTRPLLFCQYPECNMFFDRLKRLNSHIRNVHKAKMDHKCDLCGKAFKYKGSVEKHQRLNRCISIKERNMAKDSQPMKEFKHLDPEEFERISKIAKEQYLEVRGSINVLKEIDDSEDEDDDISGTEGVNKIERTIVTVDTIKMEDDDHDDVHQSEDFLNLSGSLPDDQNEVKVKIEIKTEPDIEYALQNSPGPDDDDWDYSSGVNFKNDPDVRHMNASLEPVVLLERLDYDTIMQWIRVKQENSDEEFVSVVRNVYTENRKSRNIHREAVEKARKPYNRRIKGLLYQCDHCSFTINYKNLLEKHMVRHKKYYKKVQHRCSHCREGFSSRTKLSSHLKIFHNIDSNTIKDFICDLCGKGFTTFGLVKSHIVNVHSTAPEISCAICFKTFKTQSYLDRHEKYLHDKVIQYPCSYCGKFYKRKEQLKKHELIHTSTPTECPICGKMVKVLGNHIRYVHERQKKPVDLIPCPTCGKGFSKHTLQLHIDRTHLKVMSERTKIRPCHKCDASFTRVDDLRRHEILVHFQGVVKRCPYEPCDAIFTRTKQLTTHVKNRHLLIERPCLTCGKIFHTRSGLLKHWKNKGHKPVDQNEENILE